MRNKLLTAFLLGLIVALLFGYTRSWDESTPTDSTVANQIDDYNRYLRVDVEERLETYIAGFNSGDSNAGFYSVPFIEKSSSPSTPSANTYLLYGLLSNGKCEFAGMDEDGDELIFTYAGKHRIGSGTAPQAFLYNTTEEDTDGGRESQIRAMGEQSGGEDSTLGYIEFSHDGTSDDEKGKIVFMVNDGDDANAPSVTALTVDSNGNVTFGQPVTIADGSVLATSGAPDANAGIANKKYVDDQVSAISTAVYIGTYTGDGSATQAVTGVGFQPAAVMIIPHANQATAFKDDEMGTYATEFVSGGYRTDIIVSLDADGFTVGDDTAVGTSNMNTNSRVYSFIAWDE